MRKPPNHRQKATIALVISCILSGSAFFFAKVPMTELAVSHVVLYRFGLGSLVLLPITLARRGWPQRQDLGLFALTGLFAVPLVFMLSFGGLALTSVSSASLIIGAFSPLLAVAAAWLFREKLGVRGWGAVIVSTLGVALVAGIPGPDHNWLGDGLVFLSLIASVAWVLLSKRLTQKYSGLVTTTYTTVFGTIIHLPLCLLWDGLPPISLSATNWASLLVLGLACTALNLVLWNWGLAHVDASHAGIFVNLEPIVGVLWGVAVLGERLGVGILLGGLLVIASAVAISLPEQEAGRFHQLWRGKRPKHAHQRSRGSVQR